MKMDAEQFFNKIRVKKLAGADSFVFEIDLNDRRISKTSPFICDNNDLKKLQNQLPPSYLKFLNTYSNGLHIEIGNSLTLFPLGDVKGFGTDVLSDTTATVFGGISVSGDFVFFGGSGVDSEMFAFYTAIRYSDGEYPIVWFTPGSVDMKPFVLLNSSFDKFLTMQYYMLKATDYHNTVETYYDALDASSDKNRMEQYEKKLQNFYDKLFDTFEPTIPKPNCNYYNSVVSLTELIGAIEKTRKQPKAEH